MYTLKLTPAELNALMAMLKYAVESPAMPMPDKGATLQFATKLSQLQPEPEE